MFFFIILTYVLSYNNCDFFSIIVKKIPQELESALCDQLQGGMEVACEAVFGVKVLLALEDKLRGIV